MKSLQKNNKLIVLTLLVGIVLVTCKGKGSFDILGSAAKDNEVLTVIDDPAVGGVVDLYPEVKLTVPPGSLPQGVTIGIEKVKSIPSGESDGFQPMNQAYRFTPAGTKFALNNPAKLTIRYNKVAMDQNGFDPRTVQMYYYDETEKRFFNVHSYVDIEKGEVTADVEHFTIYLPMAKTLIPGNNAPAISLQDPVPNVIRANAPIYIRARVRDFDVSGAISGVELHYRKLIGNPTFTTVAMTRELVPGSLNRFGYLIPASYLQTADLVAGNDFEYFITATDNLGVVATSATVSFDIVTSYFAGSVFVSPSNQSIAAGFQRRFSVQANDNNGQTFTLIPESVSVGNNIGILTELFSRGVQFEAENTGIGTVNASFGTEQGSATVTVYNGQLDRIAILDENIVAINAPFTVSGNTSYSFDVLGYDEFGNTVYILPDFSVTGGIGTIDQEGNFTASGAGTGTIIASLGTITTSITIVVDATPFLNQLIILNENNQPFMAGQTVYVKRGSQYQFSTLALDQYGDFFPITPQFSTTVGSIDNSGQFIGANTGAGEVTLTAAGKTSNINIEVVTPQIVYVSATAVDDSNDGTINTPLKTIAAGINQANQYSPIKGDVHVAAGDYIVNFDNNTHIKMVNGVSLFGGYTTGFTQKDGVSKITDDSTSGNNTYAVYIPAGVGSSTLLDGFTIEGGSHPSTFKTVSAIAIDGTSINTYPTIQNNVIYGTQSPASTGTYSYGIRCLNGSSAVVQKNQIFGFTGVGSGNVTQRAIGTNCRGIVQQNRIERVRIGIQGKPALVANNIIIAQKVRSIGSPDVDILGTGIDVSGFSRLYNNTIITNYIGIYYHDFGKLEIINNIIEQDGSTEACLYKSSVDLPAKIQNNYFRKCSVVHFAYNEELCPSDPALCSLTELETLSTKYNNNAKNEDVVFTDGNAGDYSLDVNNTFATEGGLDLSSYFSFDFSGNIRSGDWTVGAYGVASSMLALGAVTTSNLVTVPAPFRLRDIFVGYSTDQAVYAWVEINADNTALNIKVDSRVIGNSFTENPIVIFSCQTGSFCNGKVTAVVYNSIAFIVFLNYESGNTSLLGRLVDVTTDPVTLLGSSNFTISTDSFFNKPEVAVDSSGKVIVVWEQSTGNSIKSRIIDLENIDPSFVPSMTAEVIEAGSGVQGFGTMIQNNNAIIHFGDNNGLHLRYLTRTASVWDYQGSQSVNPLPLNESLDTQDPEATRPKLAMSNSEVAIAYVIGTVANYDLKLRRIGLSSFQNGIPDGSATYDLIVANDPLKNEQAIRPSYNSSGTTLFLAWHEIDNISGLPLGAKAMTIDSTQNTISQSRFDLSTSVFPFIAPILFETGDHVFALTLDTPAYADFSRYIFTGSVINVITPTIPNINKLLFSINIGGDASWPIGGYPGNQKINIVSSVFNGSNDVLTQFTIPFIQQ